MKEIEVVNIKCGGCAKSIEDSLTKKGFKEVSVDPSCQKVFFEGDQNEAEEILNKMGYPKAGTEEAKSYLKKAKSFRSCMIGRLKK